MGRASGSKEIQALAPEKRNFYRSTGNLRLRFKRSSQSRELLNLMLEHPSLLFWPEYKENNALHVKCKDKYILLEFIITNIMSLCVSTCEM